MLERPRDTRLETDFSCDAGNRDCDAAETAMPDVLASVRRDRVVSRTRFSNWYGLLATDHQCLPDPDGRDPWLSSEATPWLWSVPHRTCCFGRGPDRKV